MSEAATSEAEKLPVVYIGPNSSKLGLAQYNHYIELNNRVQDAITKYPALNILFVPLDQFGTRAPAIYAGREASLVHAIKQLVKDGVL